MIHQSLPRPTLLAATQPPGPAPITRASHSRVMSPSQSGGRMGTLLQCVPTAGSVTLDSQEMLRDIHILLQGMLEGNPDRTLEVMQWPALIRG
jgi:hypothetical protein